MTTLMAFFQMSEPNNFNGYLVLGYFVMWVVGMLYIFSLVMRQRNVRQDLQLLHQLLQEDDDSAEM
ncbi:MAG: hypothetical protein M9928_01675 [Anaerolineae bacterium]|nr:hypothetical protein [Anaerolineae bacterium]MCO5203720.1 hypothetical protein [Anaerolineae bacterium]